MNELEIRQIKRDLEDRGFELKDIASDIDVQPQYISNQLRMTRPAQRVLDAIAERMKAPLVDGLPAQDGTAPL